MNSGVVPEQEILCVLESKGNVELEEVVSDAGDGSDPRVVAPWLCGNLKHVEVQTSESGASIAARN